MSRERTVMKKLRPLLRLKFESKLTHRQIGRALNISPGSVSYYVQAAVALGVNWPLPESMENDDVLMEKIEIHAKHLRKTKQQKEQPDWATIHQELNKRHMTLMLLWEDYKTLHGKNVHSYSQFTRLYKKWCKQKKVSMRFEHTAGEKAFIDYAGSTLPIYCRQSKKILFHAQLFIMTLGLSDYTFAYASRSQKLPDWIGAHVKAFQFFGGVPKVLVPDNLKSGIVDSCKFEPLANPTYADMAEHYHTAVIPARPRAPKDKSKAENGVLVAQRWLVTRLDKSKFYSLEALNNAITDLLQTMNHKKFQKRQGSRYSQYFEQEKAHLQPLPNQPYEFAKFLSQTIPADYHVRVDHHYYSVPHVLIGQKVLIRYTTSTVEILHKNQRQASHFRSYEKDKKTTIPEHMPKAHQLYNSWTPQVFLDWAEKSGVGIYNAASEIIKIKTHPEQCYKIYTGFKKLAKQFGHKRLNDACRRAITLNCLQFRSIQSILLNGLDKQPHIAEVAVSSTPQHSNLRGADYYCS